MNTLIYNMMKSMRVRSDARRIYRILQKHLDTMPIGYPSTPTGVELRLLTQMFTAEEAEAALNIGWRPETFDEIYRRARLRGFLEEDFRELIDSMASKGCIYSSISGDQKRYACHPLVVGMYEMQLNRLTSNLYLDLRNYILQRFSVEYYTSEVRQMRVIPIHTSVTPQLAIAAYDDIRQIVDQANDRISVSDCICRAAKDSIGEHCRTTERRELCIQFRDFHDIYMRNGIGRAISKQEAFELLDQNEKEGLVLMPTSLQEPQFVCSCCRCCCGILELVGIMPRSVDFVESNYMARLDAKACNGCGKCKARCHMEAILFEGKKAVSIDKRKCIGCGLCVPACPKGSLALVRKDKEFLPPRDLEELYSVIDGHRKSTLGKYSMMLKALAGREV
jgi:Na+-translocating ferredoxin:NAD+ oxidoreductase subunit B